MGTTKTPREITRADIIPLTEYERNRKERRAALVELKKPRRVEVGPHATFYFESYDTMWHQIHEMLYIEKGGEEQVEDELRAYNPLIPKGRELVATLMFEIDDPVRRLAILKKLTHIEEHTFIQVGDAKIMADPEQDVERTAPDGKTSSVHFLHFHFTPDQIAQFRDPAVQVLLGFSHENYSHLTVLQPATRTALAADFE